MVTGRVQGVGFRFSTQRVGRQLGLAGWVRNIPGGAVEAWVQGPEPAVQQMRDYIAEGPFGAIVRSIEVAAVDPDPSLDDFEIRF